MNLPLLVILNILVLYFILRHQKRNCIECNQTLTLFLVLILSLYEIYMIVGYNKKKDNNN